MLTWFDNAALLCHTLQNHIFSLQKSSPDRVIALRGNHEEWFLDFLDGKEDTWLGADINLRTSRTFLTNEQLEKIKTDFAGDAQKVYAFIRKCINENHKELIAWMRNLPYYYETDKQIFVHAGIDEEAGEWWEWGTSDYYFVNKYPATTGEFYKDIIAGHVGTASISGNKDFHDTKRLNRERKRAAFSFRQNTFSKGGLKDA